MKRSLILTSLLLVSTSLFSCGKKSEDNKAPTKDLVSPPSGAEIYFKTLQEIKRAINGNDLISLKNVFKKNPDLDVNYTFNDTGDTLLITAIKKDFRDIRDFLISLGASLEVTNINKETPLISAVAHERKESVIFLINQKVDLEKRDQNQDTALHAALKKSFDEIALILIENGADINAPDANGKNAWKLAQENNVPQSHEKIKNIIEIGTESIDVMTYRTIILEGDYRRLSRILSRFPSMASDEIYESINPFALLVDLRDGERAIRTAELLLSYKANVNGFYKSQIIPIIKATAFGEFKLLSLYLSNGADINKLDQYGKSALIYAIERNDPELVELLLSYSAEKKYAIRRNGKRTVMNACHIARSVRSKLSLPEEKRSSDRIIENLDCGLWGLFF